MNKPLKHLVYSVFLAINLLQINLCPDVNNNDFFEYEETTNQTTILQKATYYAVCCLVVLAPCLFTYHKLKQDCRFLRNNYSIRTFLTQTQQNQRTILTQKSDILSPKYFTKYQNIANILTETETAWLLDNADCSICCEQLIDEQLCCKNDITITTCSHIFCTKCLHTPVKYDCEIPEEDPLLRRGYNNNPQTIETAIHGHKCPICNQLNSF